MEHNGGNQNMHVATLCRNGCGFYANSQFDGMCSKCYKDIVKRRQQNPSPTQVSGRATPTGLESTGSSLESSLSSVSSTPVSCATPSCTISTPAPNGASINTATPTVPTTNAHDKATSNTKEEGATGGVEVASSSKEKESPEKEKKPKKNRCHSCKKKVGLTGFECRCGGMFCSLHRYSDKHDCTFNYKEMAQLQIRKNNPVVVGEKIQKI